jgi:hypothetical protein
MKQLLVLVVFLTLLSSGCLSQIAPVNEAATSWIGHPIAKREALVRDPNSYASRIGWRETLRRLDNGNSVYIEPVRKECLIYWEVNPLGIIVDYRLEGEACY